MSRVFYQDNTTDSLINASSVAFVIQKRHRRRRRNNQQTRAAKNIRISSIEIHRPLKKKGKSFQGGAAYRNSSTKAAGSSTATHPRLMHSTSLGSHELPSIHTRQQSTQGKNNDSISNRQIPGHSAAMGRNNAFLPPLLDILQSMSPSPRHLERSFIQHLIYHEQKVKEGLYLICYLALCEKRYEEAVKMLRGMIRDGVRIDDDIEEQKEDDRRSATASSGSRADSVKLASRHHSQKQNTSKKRRTHTALAGDRKTKQLRNDESYSSPLPTPLIRLKSVLSLLCLCWIDHLLAQRYGFSGSQDIYDWLKQQEEYCLGILSGVKPSGSSQKSLLKAALKQHQGTYYISPSPSSSRAKQSKSTKNSLKRSDSTTHGSSSLTPITAFTISRNTGKVSAPPEDEHLPPADGSAINDPNTPALQSSAAKMSSALQGIQHLYDWRRKMERSTCMKSPSSDEDIFSVCKRAEKMTPFLSQLAQLHMPWKFFGPLSLKELFLKVYFNSAERCVNLCEAIRSIQHHLISDPSTSTLASSAAAQKVCLDDSLLQSAAISTDPFTEVRIPQCSLEEFELWMHSHKTIQKSAFLHEWQLLKDDYEDEHISLESFSEQLDVDTLMLKHYICSDNIFNVDAETNCPHASLFEKQDEESRIFFMVYLPRQNAIHFGVSESTLTFSQLQWRFGQVVTVFVEPVNHVSAEFLLEELKGDLGEFLIANSHYAAPTIDLKTFILQDLSNILGQIDCLHQEGRNSPMRNAFTEQDSKTDGQHRDAELTEQIMSLTSKYKDQEDEIIALREQLLAQENKINSQKDILREQAALLNQRTELIEEKESMLKVKDHHIEGLKTDKNRLERQAGQIRSHQNVNSETTFLCLKLKQLVVTCSGTAQHLGGDEQVYFTLHTISESSTGQETECRSSEQALPPWVADEGSQGVPDSQITLDWEEECLFVSAKRSESLIFRVWFKGECIGEHSWSYENIDFWNQNADMEFSPSASPNSSTTTTTTLGMERMKDEASEMNNDHWRVHFKLSKVTPVHLFEYISRLHTKQTC